MGLVQPEVRRGAYLFMLEQSVCKTKVLHQENSGQDPRIWSTWLGSGGPRSHLRGALDCTMLYRVTIDALQTRIISRCNETYHLTTRQRRSVHRFNDSIGGYLNDLRYDILSLPQAREVSSPPRKCGNLKRSYGTCIGNSPTALLPEMVEQLTFEVA